MEEQPTLQQSRSSSRSHELSFSFLFITLLGFFTSTPFEVKTKVFNNSLSDILGAVNGI